jgi:hypothetical protein
VADDPANVAAARSKVRRRKCRGMTRGMRRREMPEASRPTHRCFPRIVQASPASGRTGVHA